MSKAIQGNKWKITMKKLVLEFSLYWKFVGRNKNNDKIKTNLPTPSFHSSYSFLNPLSANSTKWSNTLKQFVGNLPTNCLSVFDYFVILAVKGLIAEKLISL